MKKLVLLMVCVFALTTLTGCGKKKSEEAALDNMTNGVVSENIVSLTDAAAGSVATVNSSIPVVIDNAESLPSTTGDMTGAIEAATDKPSPKLIQQALKNAGIYSGKIDGNIGPKTKKAIEEFQSQNGLKPDGKVGPKTWKALSAHLTQTTEVANPTAQTQN